MKTIKIYTAGKMAGLDLHEQLKWRNEIDSCVMNAIDNLGLPRSIIKFVHPPLYYEYGKDYHQTEREVKNWDLNQVRESDIVIVKLDDVESSIGTHYELATVDAINSFENKHIFVIGIGGKDKELHPWIEDTLHRREDDYQKAADYIVNYLIV